MDAPITFLPSGLTTVFSLGLKGDAGKSAYQAAVDGGFAGTESEWLASLGNFTVSATAPTSPQLNDVWIDIS